MFLLSLDRQIHRHRICLHIFSVAKLPVLDNQDLIKNVVKLKMLLRMLIEFIENFSNLCESYIDSSVHSPVEGLFGLSGDLLEHWNGFQGFRHSLQLWLYPVKR